MIVKDVCFICDANMKFIKKYIERFKEYSKTSPFAQRSVWVGHFGTFRDIFGTYGHFGTFWDISRQFGRLFDEFGAFDYFLP